MVYLGANACIIGRNVEKTESMAREIAAVRKGAKVLGIGAVDVRSVSWSTSCSCLFFGITVRADNYAPQFESLQGAVDRCIKELGQIDFVIAGAAGNFVAPLAGLTPGGFKAVMEIDTFGTFNTIKAVMPALVESAARNKNPPPRGQVGTGGRIIAISATFHYNGTPLQAHAAAAKAGVDSLLASVALEYGPLGVVANVITPGAIAGTEGMERLAGGGTDAEQRMSPAIPSGRWGTVRDIADSTVYLFSDASNYVNGHVLVVDGASWRSPGSMSVGLDEGMQYPNFLFTGHSKNIKTGKKESKL